MEGCSPIRIYRHAGQTFGIRSLDIQSTKESGWSDLKRDSRMRSMSKFSGGSRHHVSCHGVNDSVFYSLTTDVRGFARVGIPDLGRPLTWRGKGVLVGGLRVEHITRRLQHQTGHGCRTRLRSTVVPTTGRLVTKSVVMCRRIGAMLPRARSACYYIDGRNARYDSPPKMPEGCGSISWGC